jgi:hypothetical protein
MIKKEIKIFLNVIFIVFNTSFLRNHIIKYNFLWIISAVNTSINLKLEFDVSLHFTPQLRS